MKYATERKGKDADIGRYKHSFFRIPDACGNTFMLGY